MDSKTTSRHFHDSLGKGGLSSLTKKSWDRAILRQVEGHLRKDQKILDVGCGYGRIAAPLLKEGYDIHGIDLSRRYIAALRSSLPQRTDRKRFRTADMRELPFADGSFDVVLCLWSTFDELILRKDQARALKEMYRVLRKGGFGLLEGHLHAPRGPVSLKGVRFHGYGGRIVKCHTGGAVYHYYNHDSESLKKIMVRSGIRNFSVKKEWFGWRDRMIVRFSK